MYNVTAINTGTRIRQSVNKYRKGVESANPSLSVIPPGYMTGDEFEKRVITRLEKSYKERGLV